MNWQQNLQALADASAMEDDPDFLALMSLIPIPHFTYLP